MNSSDTNQNLLRYSLPFRKKENLWIPEFTRYWLRKETPLGIAVSNLESKGYIKQIEEKIASNQRYLEEIRQLHRQEIQIRIQLFQQKKALLPEKDQERLWKLISDPDIGIGGIRNWQNHGHIKCLHLWVAYALGDPEHFSNPIASWVFEEIKQLHPKLAYLIQNWEKNMFPFSHNPRKSFDEN